MRSFTSPGGSIDVLGVDVSEDGEPTSSVEVFSETHRGKRRLRIRIGNTAGESHTYTYPGRGYGIAHYMASAMAKEWWGLKCNRCGSTERAVRLLTARYEWSGPAAGREQTYAPCDFYWHEVDGAAQAASMHEFPEAT